MNSLPPRQDTPGGVAPGRPVLVGLLLLAVVLGGLRLYTWDEPIERDIAFYAAVGHEMAHGKRLYTEVWDHYLPGVTSTYMLAEMLFGYGPLQLYALWTLAAWLTMVAVFRAGASTFDGAGVGTDARLGLLAAGLYVAIAGDMMLQANQPNTEIFINVGVTWAFALMVTYPRQATRGRPELIGLLLAVAIVYKQVALFTAVGLVLAHVVAPPGPRRRALLDAVRMAATGIAVGAALIGYFAVTGRLREFWDNVISFSLYWASINSGAAAGPLQVGQLWIPEMRGLLPLVVAACLGLLAVRGIDRRGALLAAWVVGAWLGISTPGTFFPHYYQLAIPVVAVAAAWSVGAWQRRTPRLAAGIAVATLVAAATLQLPAYTVAPRDWPLRKYGDYGQLFIDAQRAGRAIGDLLDPGEQLWQWGYEPQLYFYSGRRPGASVMLLFGMTDGPVADSLAARVLSELQEHAPELIVTHPLYVLPPGHGITTWIERRYRPLPEPTGAEPFRLLGRRGWRPPRQADAPGR